MRGINTTGVVQDYVSLGCDGLSSSSGIVQISMLSIGSSSSWKNGLTTVVQKFVGPCSISNVHYFPSIARSRNGPVHPFFSLHTLTSDCSISYTVLRVEGPFCIASAFLIWRVALIYLNSCIVVRIVFDLWRIDCEGISLSDIRGYAPKARRVSTSPSGPAVLLAAFVAS